MFGICSTAGDRKSNGTEVISPYSSEVQAVFRRQRTRCPINPLALNAGQPLLLNGHKDFLTFEQASGTVMRSTQAEDPWRGGGHNGHTWTGASRDGEDYITQLAPERQQQRVSRRRPLIRNG